jgi:hypothetical protein
MTQPAESDTRHRAVAQVLGKHIRAARQEGKPFMTSDRTGTGLPSLWGLECRCPCCRAWRRSGLKASDPFRSHIRSFSIFSAPHQLGRSAQFEKGKTRASPPFVEPPCEVFSCMWSSGMTDLQCISRVLRRPFDTLRHATGLKICRLMIDLYSLVFVCW